MPKTTISDVARLANVSIKTVSRVVNKETNVSWETREKVHAAIAELQYTPNHSARNLASHRSYLVGLIYDDPAAYENPSAGYVVNIQQGALAACKAANHDLLIHPCNYREDNVTGDLQARIRTARPDGIVLAAPLSNMRKLIDAIEATRTPLVCISPGEQSAKQPSVATNDREICCEMTEYLASLGHRRIAFIKGHPGHKAVAKRFSGYQDGLRKSGLEYSEHLVSQGDNSFDSGEHCARRLLEQNPPPTAIFAANDDMAAGVIRLADRLDISIPKQLSVAGFDDVALARQIYPALTTISQPLVAMAEKATEIVISANNSAVHNDTVIVPATLQIRESTGPAPT